LKGGRGQQFLYVAPVSAAVEQVRGEGMPQRVGTDVVNAGAEAYVLFDQTSHERVVIRVPGNSESTVARHAL